EVVAGGVALDEVGPQTMRSRLIDGLYLCGEVLDIAGPVGGYNLQAAWSTGWVAGEAAIPS
ncbi:MAG: NAD(P)/FAD-dependent oxidoreductase, partial [Armatimonadota bacterium]|nr:NAD(P)/FAD-dependent oxidoreductase [Armatimonadota bacterium]